MSSTLKLNVLERIQIASPCSARWEDMRGDEKVRYCGQCRLSVYNLSAMTRPEAEAVVANAEGRLCAGLFRRADGTVVTQDCPVGLAALRARLRRVASRAAATLGLLVTGGLLLGPLGRANAEARLRNLQPFAAIREWLSPTPIRRVPTMLMGKVCIPTASPPQRQPAPGRGN